MEMNKMMNVGSYFSSPSKLPHDVWLDIFLRLPLESIFRLRRVSKLWRSLLSNPFFITKWMSSNPSSSWILVYYGCYTTDHFIRHPNLRDFPFFSTASFGVHSKFLFHYDEFTSGIIQEGKIFLLASSNGLVLCSTTRIYATKYYIYNPLTDEWVSLPPSPRYHNKSVLTGFICDSSSSSLMNPTSYTVVLIPASNITPSTIFDVQIFSSDLGQWNSYQVSCHEQVTWTHDIAMAVSHINGVLYWFEGGGNRIIAYYLNDDKTQCKLINLPMDFGDGDDIDRRIVESEGSLCCCIINRLRMTLSLGVLKEDCLNGGWVWDMVHRNVELKGVKSTNFTFLAMNPEDRNVLILRHSEYILEKKRYCECEYIFAYNIGTRTSERLHLHAFQAKHGCVPWSASILPYIIRPMPTRIPPLVRSDH